MFCFEKQCNNRKQQNYQKPVI